LIKGLLSKIEDDFKHKLIHSKVLKWILITGLSSAIFIAGMIVYNAWTIELCKPIFSGTCLSNFSYNMKFPATLITATLALSGFWALIFRSHQTSAQIETSQKQTQLTIDNNTFNNYIAHKKAFNDILYEIEEQYRCKILNKSFIYDSIFPSNSPTNISFTSDGSYLTKRNKDYENILKELAPNMKGIIEKDPMIDPDIGLEIGHREDFIYMDTYMKYLSDSIESFHIKGTNFEKVTFPDRDEFQQSNTTILVPMDLKASLWLVMTLFGRLSKFSNTNCKLIAPSPDFIKAIDIYTRTAQLIIHK